MRDILVHSKLWLSSPLDFNDPFDMAAKLIAQADVKDRRKRYDGLLKERGLNWSKRQRELARLTRMSSKRVAELAQTGHEKSVELTGVYSFGGDPRSILMWSHYASNHEGVCLQFEIAKDPETFVFALPVEYSDEYPIVNWFGDFSKDIIPTILRKYKGWEYERERRLVVPERAHQFLSFRPEAVQGIIVGCRAKDETITTLRNLISERTSLHLPKPRLYRAVRHESEYRLVIKAFMLTM
jgi:hypothetical protein